MDRGAPWFGEADFVHLQLAAASKAAGDLAGDRLNGTLRSDHQRPLDHHGDYLSGGWHSEGSSSGGALRRHAVVAGISRDPGGFTMVRTRCSSGLAP